MGRKCYRRHREVSKVVSDKVMIISWLIIKVLINEKHTVTNKRGPSENKEVYRIFFSIDVN